jgi:hypothetical protein
VFRSIYQWILNLNHEHDPVIEKTIETATMLFPNGDPDQVVKINIVTTKCKKCGLILDLQPNGIVD